MTTWTASLAILGLPNGAEWIVLIVIGLLLFGRRLPEVGRSLGRSIVEFKKGIKGIEDEIDEEVERPSRRSDRVESRPAESLPSSGGGEARVDETVTVRAEPSANGG